VNKQRLGLRIAATFLAVSALALLALQPAFLIRKRTQTAILLTQNPSKYILVSLQKKYPSALLLDYAGLSGYPNLTKIVDLSYLQRKFPQIHQLYILGNGIPEYDLKELANISIKLLPNPLPEGIVALQIPSKITTNIPFEIRGTLYTKSPQNQSIILSNVAGNLDSMTIKGQGKHTFRLQALAKNAGNYLFQIKLKTADKIIQQENIPLTIRDGKKLRVWILNSSPNFESKYLKNYLGDAGYTVGVRAVISAGKFKDEWVNAKEQIFYFGQNLAEKVDILIIDTDYWYQLGAGEQTYIQQAITASGLGVLIFGNEDITKNNQHPLLRSFALGAYKADTLVFSAPAYQEKAQFALSRLPFRFQANWSVIPLLQDAQGNVGIAYKVNGNGKVALSLLPETYHMTLAGQRKLYEIFWANLLNQLAPTETPSQVWKSEKSFHFTDEPTHWTLQTTEKQPIGILKSPADKSEKIYFRQSPQMEENRQATFWAKEKGWHSLQTEADSTNPHSFYVFEPTAWQSIKITAQLNANQSWANHPENNNSQNTLGDFTDTQAIDLLWFYGLFLFSAGFLWVEGKL
jgi:hypothetical protein